MSRSTFKPLPLNEQTIVITGASSGIGLATAKMAGRLGANVVMAARSENELQKCAEEITAAGGKALAVAADVSKYEDLKKIKDEALSAFGAIDTWINNAGVSIFGYLMEGDFKEERKLFDVNFWGMRMGSSIAIEAMRERGGTLINMGSETSVAAQPLLGIYSASKHAIKAYTDSLRSELKDLNVPVEVCLIRPTAIDTPFAEHAADRLKEGKPTLPTPVYEPDVAAEAILKCAVSPQRDVYVGGPARLSAILDTFFPRIKDVVAETRMKELRKGKERGSKIQSDGVAEASGEGRTRSSSERKALKNSIYTNLTTTFRHLKKLGNH